MTKEERIKEVKAEIKRFRVIYNTLFANESADVGDVVKSLKEKVSELNELQKHNEMNDKIIKQEALRKELKLLTEHWKSMSVDELQDTKTGRETTRRKREVTLLLKVIEKPKMTKQERNQQSAHWKIQRDRAIKNIKEVDDQYIKDNAPNPIGTMLRIDCGGNKRTARVVSYIIHPETGFLTPQFETLEGKPVFHHKPTIIKVLSEETIK